MKTTSSRLTTPEPGRDAAAEFVSAHLAHLCLEAGVGETPQECLPVSSFRGGQRGADAALAGFDVTGYAHNRNEAYPSHRRGASQLSPYIRHGLLQLERVWSAVQGGPRRDVEKFRDELLWQEYARHWYARLGHRTAHGLRHRYDQSANPGEWDTRMGCLELPVEELEEDGWLVNQTRMWLASHRTVRHRSDWRDGEDYFFRHLVDGSRAANRLGWQWATGVGSSRVYGFSRWQVEKRAPGLCASCELGDRCPIDRWPDDPDLERIDPDPLLRLDPAPDATRGPSSVEIDGTPEAVWLTAESLGDDDPALAAWPDLPVVFVFDEPLLRRLRLSSKRLVFLTECLSDLGARRPVELLLGEPGRALAGRPLATTYAPVPGWRRRARKLDLAEVHPWPWLRAPGAGNIASFASWRRQL